MKKRGQISLEYMLIIGVTTILLISLFAFSRYYSRQTETTINTNQVDRIAKEIVDSAESMYYFGEPSKITLKVFMPEGIRSVNISTNEICFKVKIQEGYSDIAYSSSVPLQGNISTSPGIHYISIEAREDYAWINST